MYVTLLGNYPHDEQESMQRYAGMLHRLLAETGCEVELLRPEPIVGRLCPSGQGLGKWLGYIDKFILFPFVLRQHIRRRRKEAVAAGLSALGEKQTFLVHICDHSNALYTRWLSDTPHLVTCHDVLAISSARGLIPGQKTSWTGRVLQGWIFSGLQRARHIACVSSQTRSELVALAPELADRTSVIENALNYPFAPMDRERALRSLAELIPALHAGDTPFLLHVGGNQWYKNREAVIPIFAQLRETFSRSGTGPLKLVMAGKDPTDAMQSLVREKKLEDAVIFPGTVTDEQLCALYSLAAAFIYPSLREGFGWPLIEAQACGCPVVASDLAPINEVAGPAALLADPRNASDFATRIAELLSEDAPRRANRGAEGRRHSAHYDPIIFREKILFTYCSIITADT